MTVAARGAIGGNLAGGTCRKRHARGPGVRPWTDQHQEGRHSVHGFFSLTISYSCYSKDHSMDRITQQNLKNLAAHQGVHCVTIYLPTHRTWPHNKPQRTHLQQLLKQVSETLIKRGKSERDIKKLLAPAHELIHPEEYWHAQGDLLALFIDDNFFRAFRLPTQGREQLTISDRFAIRPLVPLVNDDLDFFVLGITEASDSRLLHCTRHTVDGVKLPAHPRTVSQATGFEQPQRGFSFHQTTSIGKGGTHHAAVIHAKGVRTDDTKEDLTEFAHALDHALHDILANTTDPLVLAADERVGAAFRQVCRYPHMTQSIIKGAPQRMSDLELRDHAWPIVEQEVLTPRLNDAVQRCTQAIEKAGATTIPTEVISSAVQGNLRELFIAHDAEMEGSIDASNSQVSVHERPHNGGEDLIERAISSALRHKTQVHILDMNQMPEKQMLVGVFWH